MGYCHFLLFEGGLASGLYASRLLYFEVVIFIS